MKYPKDRNKYSHTIFKKLKRIKSCQSCGYKINLQKHHIIPISEGGTNNIKNIKILCFKCHKDIHCKSKVKER